MLRIPVNNTQKENIENIYRQWIKKHLQSFKEIIKNDEKLYYIIFGKNEYNEKDLLDFLLMNAKNLTAVKEKCDAYNTIKIKEETKDYLYSRHKNFRSSQTAKIVKELDILSCPYCNQNDLITYQKKGKRKFIGDLDHFYNKSEYPELMICLYNLIPSCKVCNQSKFKSNKKIINPYDLSYKMNITFKTTFDYECKLDYLYGMSNHFKIIIDKSKLSNEELNENEIFELEERYKHCKDYVKEIILKTRAYPHIYIKKMSEMFGGVSEEKLMQYIFSFRDDHLKRSFSKFNQDIMNEFKEKKDNG